MFGTVRQYEQLRMTMLPCVHLNAAKGYNATFTVDVSLRAVPGRASRRLCTHLSPHLPVRGAMLL